MMQKKLIVVALAAAFALPVSALADNGNFTFYGTANVSYDMVRTGNGTTTANNTPGVAPIVAGPVAGIAKRVVSSNVSKFGFKGSTDLGDGLAAVWQIEQQVNIDDSAANTFASRNTFAGLKSDSLGTVLMGRHDTPYKIAVRKLDVFGDNIADNRALIGKQNGLGFELRPANVLAYISPAFAGVTAAVATASLTEANTNNAQRNSSALSLAVMYDAAPIYASLAHELHKLDGTAGGAKESATRLGFGFTQDMFSVGLVYEKTTDDQGNVAAHTDKYGHSAYYLSGKFNLGNDAVKFAYGKVGTLGAGATQVANSSAKQMSVGYDHGLGKNTQVYAMYTKLSNGKGSNYGFSQNSGAASTTSGFGTSPSALSLGLKHSF